MTLNDILKKVEPILGGDEIFQFAHPSFREVLAARQCADEINSGRLNIKDVPVEKERRRAGRGRALFNEFYLHMVNLVNEDKAKEFVCSVGDMHAESIARLSSDFPKWSDDSIINDLLTCAAYVGKFKNTNFPDGQAKEILDALLLIERHICSAHHDFHFSTSVDFVKDALALTGSNYVVRKLIDIIRYSDRELFLGTTRFYRPHYTAIELAKSGADVEGYLLELLPKRDARGNAGFFHLLADVGGLKSLEALIQEMPRENSFASVSSNSNHLYFLTIFSILRRYDFNPNQIKLFNEKISNVENGEFLKSYHHALELFAKLFSFRGNLYDHLEAKGVQFFDSWVYKPK